MYWNINTLVPLFALLTYGVLLLVVSLSKPSTQERQGFRAYLLTMFAWSASSFITMTGWGDTLFWFRFMSASATASMAGIFYFVQVFFHKRDKWTYYIYIYAVIAVLLTLLTNLVVLNAEIVNHELVYELNNLIAFISGPAFLITLHTLTQLINGYRHSRDPVQRNRIQYLILGLAIIVIASTVNFTPLGKYPIDIAANSITALLIAYTILRHQLLDISLVIRKSVLYSIPTTIIGALYFLIITFSLSIFQTHSGVEVLMLSILVAIFSALIFQPFRDLLQSWIDKLFFREKYDSNLMLQRVSQSASRFLDANLLANMILDEISSTLHIKTMAFFLKQKRGKDFGLIAQRGIDHDVNIHLKADHPIVMMLSTQDTVITSYDLDVLPQFKSLWSYERYSLEQIGAKLFIPLKAQDKLVGIITVGEKQSEEAYDYNDQTVLSTLANQTAVAIENARLYSLEQSRRKELDELNFFTRQLITTDDPEHVFAAIVKGALEIIHVTFSRLYVTDENNEIICRAGYPVNGLGFDLNINNPIPGNIEPIYKKVLNGGQPVVIESDSPDLVLMQKEDYLIGQVSSICLCPLQVGEDFIGLLELAERRNTNRETFSKEKLRLAKAIADQSAGAIQRVNLHEQLEESFMQTVFSLANALDARDHYTNDHGAKLSQLAEDVARKHGCTEKDVDAIHWAMQLHDIGKIGVPDNILRKPGPLNDEEWALMRQHPEIGAKIVEPVKILRNVAPLIRSHHEKFDGTGYPDKLCGEDIPIGARILTLVDAYGAITDERIYQKARSHEEAMVEIHRCTGTQFDPQIVKAFASVINHHKH